MFRYLAAAIGLACLGACTTANFIGDGPPIEITEQTPDAFELPARIGLARLVYGQISPVGAREAALWEDLITRAKDIGTFQPLLPIGMPGPLREDALISAAREQRFDYLLVVAMNPRTASADLLILHVGSGGLMASAQAVADQPGQNGFWGGQIRNPSRLRRVALGIAQAAQPEVEALLQGMIERQR